MGIFRLNRNRSSEDLRAPAMLQKRIKEIPATKKSNINGLTKVTGNIKHSSKHLSVSGHPSCSRSLEPPSANNLGNFNAEYLTTSSQLSHCRDAKLHDPHTFPCTSMKMAKRTIPPLSGISNRNITQKKVSPGLHK